MDRCDRTIAIGILVTAFILSCSTAGQAQGGAIRSALLDRAAGTWSGVGVIDGAGGQPQRLACQVTYTPVEAAQLRLNLRCVMNGFTLQVASDLARRDQTLAGTWVETGTGLSGDVAGTVGRSGLQATIAGLGTTAVLKMTLRGTTQAISVVSRGLLTARATLALRRI